MMKEKLLQEAYEQIEVPREDVQQAIRNGVQMGAKSGKSKRPLFRISTIAVALLVASFVTLSVAFPSFAEKIPFMDNIYEFFRGNNQEFVFEEYGDKSTDINLTKESKGVRVTITDAVYDRESITIAYKIKSDHDLGDDAVLSGVELEIEEIINPLNVGQMLPNKIGENEYAGILIATLVTGQEADQVHVKWKGDIVRSIENPEISVSGDWSFQFTLDALESKTSRFTDGTYQVYENGFGIELTRMTTTPISWDFHFAGWVDKNLDGFAKEKWERVLYDYKIYDDLGKEYEVIFMSSYGDNNEFGDRIRTTMVDKNASSLTIIPMVEIYDIDWNLLEESFDLEPINVPLDK
ncbi:DUF4179 domain-containing protein [Ornithinibacillus sp. L9]|uniref:DUF4179 domain-containing protein n=1 Tax=Ornithinibacillus caprae TaxID=2678566 RepID=A0A6N8FPF1_9BACI|nr:DUF4179 domain-containing protein [Ornithinibacillus caprae]MUK90514.1 DUF4179 domain-containing protein [Ornithinibacillus caprae]